MKTRDFVLTALGLLLAVTVSATKIPTLNVVPLKEQRALMAFESEKPTAVEVSLKNQKGETLYYKKSKAAVEELKLILNFKNLVDGVYDVSVELDNCKLNRQIKLTGHKVSEVGDASRTYGPYCKFEDNLLKISYLNTTQNNVLLNLYHQGKHVAGKKLGKEMCIQKAIDLSKLEKGEYSVVIGDKLNKFYFVINK
ncbi:MAG TPA: hypothetical protein VFD91_15960 [Mariniphaga sp.]|nr:hypothetical protein [Mariniphaga sp.]